MVDDLETKMISVVAKGNQAIADMRKRNDREQLADKTRLRSTIMTKVFDDYNDKTEKEKETLRRAVVELEEKYQRQEQAKLEKTKRLKAARIQAHLDEVEQAKQAQHKQQDEYKWDMANRFRNAEVNAAYGRQSKEELRRKQADCKAVLQQQMAQNVTTEQDRYVLNVYETEHNRDDEQFLEYAQELIDAAEAKKRPILPLLRVVDKYKRENGLVTEEHQSDNADGGCASSPVIKYDRDELRRLNSGTSMPAFGNSDSRQLPWKVAYWRTRRATQKC